MLQSAALEPLHASKKCKTPQVSVLAYYNKNSLSCKFLAKKSILYNIMYTEKTLVDYLAKVPYYCTTASQRYLFYKAPRRIQYKYTLQYRQKIPEMQS
jgi:hypothetical protein